MDRVAGALLIYGFERKSQSANAGVYGTDRYEVSATTWKEGTHTHLAVSVWETTASGGRWVRYSDTGDFDWVLESLIDWITEHRNG